MKTTVREYISIGIGFGIGASWLFLAVLNDYLSQRPPYDQLKEQTIARSADRIRVSYLLKKIGDCEIAGKPFGVFRWGERVSSSDLMVIKGEKKRTIAGRTVMKKGDVIRSTFETAIPLEAMQAENLVFSIRLKCADEEAGVHTHTLGPPFKVPNHR